MDNLDRLLGILQKFTTGELKKAISENGNCYYEKVFDEDGIDIRRCVIGQFLYESGYRNFDWMDDLISIHIKNCNVLYEYFAGIDIRLIELIQECHDITDINKSKNAFYRLEGRLGKKSPEWLIQYNKKMNFTVWMDSS